MTDRITCLAHADGAAFFVLVLPPAIIEVGRNRLWRVRDKFIPALPPEVRQLPTGSAVSAASHPDLRRS